MACGILLAAAASFWIYLMCSFPAGTFYLHIMTIYPDPL